MGAAAIVLAACFAVPANAQMPVSLPATVEFPEETAALVAATADFFESVEAQAGPRDTRPVISGLIVATPAKFGASDGKASVLISNGPVDHLTGYGIKWYPVDRLLGTVDYMGTWDDNRNLVCGFVTWDLSDPGAPVLEEVSASFLDISVLSDESGPVIHAALLEANCAFGAIDANYTLFE